MDHSHYVKFDSHWVNSKVMSGWQTYSIRHVMSKKERWMMSHDNSYKTMSFAKMYGGNIDGK